MTHTNMLVWITPGDIPMHRRSLKISEPLPEVLVGSSFHVERHQLVMDSISVFDMVDAPVWHAPRPDHILEVGSLYTRIDSFFSALDLSRARGFGNFISQILCLSADKTIPRLPEFAEPVLTFAQSPVLAVARGCLEHQVSRITENAHAIIGLGSGLTPSGDDFLGGLLFALKILRSSYPDQYAGYGIPVGPYCSRTHLISSTLIEDHASGHAIAPLHHMINCLLGGEPLERIHPFVSELTRVGHSTGWDLLTGLLVGLLIVFRENDALPSHRPNDPRSLSMERK